MKMDVIIGGKYRHYKGNEYVVLAIAFHSETEEEMVVYQAQYGEQKIWVRPKSMWNETITLQNGEQVLRFQLL